MEGGREIRPVCSLRLQGIGLGLESGRLRNTFWLVRAAETKECIALEIVAFCHRGVFFQVQVGGGWVGVDIIMNIS